MSDMNTKTKRYPITPGMCIILATAVILLCAGSCKRIWAQEAALSPPLGLSLEEVWEWCSVQPATVHFKRPYQVSQHQVPFEERLKVPGPAWKTPFGSIVRWRNYIEKYNNQGFAGLNNQGWNYQTLETTGFPPVDPVEWEVGGE